MHIYAVTADNKTSLFTSAKSAVNNAARQAQVKRHSPQAVSALRKGETLVFVTAGSLVRLEKVKLNDKEVA